MTKYKTQILYVTTTILFWLLCYTSTAQLYKVINLKREWPTLATSFLSGTSDGTAETLRDHYSQFKNTFPNANDRYWDPRISWTNKYKNGDPRQGPKFPLSTTVFVWTTDGYHLMRFSRNTLLVTTIALNVRGRRKFKHHVANLLIHTASYHLGFNTTHKLIFQ